jgi:protein O-mannosyl-transferase
MRLAAIAFLAHAACLGAGFVFDDRGAILENRVVQGELDLGAIVGTDFWGAAPGEGPGTWRPLVVLSFWLNQRVLRGWFHETNLLLHVGAVVALGLALARQTRRTTFAVFAATVFGALGVHTEAVVGLVGRADVMAAGLSFVAWYLVGRADEPNSKERLAGAALAFAGALACKESAIVFPFVVVLADGILTPGRSSLVRGLARHGALVVAAAAVFASRVAAFAGPLSVRRDLQGNPLLAEGFGATLFTSMRLFGMALRRIFLPVGLSADYSYAAVLPDRTPLALGVALGAALFAGVVFAAIRLRTREPLLSLAAVMLVVPWIAVSHLPFVLPTLFAERLLYLPAAGFALAMGRLAEWQFERTPGVGAQKSKPPKAPVDRARWRAAAIVLGPVLALNVALAWRRAAAWKNDHTLFEAAIEVVPGSARAHHNYGTALLNEGKASMAIGPLLRATEILPSWSEPHAQLGVALLEAGRPREAEEHFRAAVELEPDGPKAVFNLALFLGREGRLGEARDVLAPFVARSPRRTREAALLRQIEADLASGTPSKK